MANNYTLFCFGFKVENPAGLNWLVEVREIINGRIIDEVPETFEEYRETCEPETFIMPEEYPVLYGIEQYGIDIEDSSEGEVIISAEESGDVDAVATILELYLKRFDPENCIGFEWANTSSPAKVGEFGGGCALVTAQGTHWVVTATCLELMTKTRRGILPEPEKKDD